MGAFLQSLRNLGPMRLAIMGGVLLGLVAFFIFLTTRLTGTQMSLLYGDLQSEDSSRIAGQLGSMNIPYEIRRNASQIFVPGDKAHSLRLQMAERGLPNGGSIGYEIFDKSDGLGTTNFVQNMNMVRALEGELSRTIRSINSVGSARVHLVLPRRELFSREKQQPSASIIIGMRGPGRLDREQVLAVQHLVAAAVPGLAPNRISIVDDKGSLLARGFDDEGGDAVAAARGDERRRAYEVRLARTIEEMLEKSVGFGKVRAEVSVEMDFDRVNVNEETFNPDGQVVRSTQTVNESRSSRESEGAAAVTVGANLPDANQSSSSGNNNAEARTEETVNYEISRKVINHVRESGLVKRLSVAVVVDGVTSAGANGERQYREREKPEMDVLATLVRTAVGYNVDRGDTVEVVNLRFAEPDIPTGEPTEIFFGLNKSDLMRMSEILVMSIVAVLVILLVVRPLLSRAFEALPSMAGAMAAEARLLAEQVAQTPALAGPGGVGAPGEEESMEELIDIDRVEGRVKASSVKKVGEIVEKHPDEALSIIRSWMYQES